MPIIQNFMPPRDFLDLDAAMVGEPTTPPQPGETARIVTQVGILSGAICIGEDLVPYLDKELIEGLDIHAKAELPGMKAIRDMLKAASEQEDGTAFIEDFMRLVGESPDVDVGTFRAAAEEFEKRNGLPHPYGVGIIAVDILGKSKMAND